MIIKINNKDEKFYQYMGKFFGSRLVERQTNDRIYDDEKKEWYLHIEKNNVSAFISVENKVLKNLYCYKEEYLEEILIYIKKHEKNGEKIGNSIVTKRYLEVYERCGFKILYSEGYKNFVTISE